jgi:serine/threonine protein kinase
MPTARQFAAEPIPGYRLLEPLGKGGYGEVWKCEAPGGLYKAIKFVYGNLSALDGSAAEEERQALEHIKAVRHPFLLSLDRVEVLDGELVIVMELADKNLHDLLSEYQAAGLPGIPREELLGYLREAAEVLDLMHTQFHLQHLDVKPQNLFLVSRHVKVADFGLVHSLSGGGKAPSIPPGAVTPLYASPETFAGTISPHCDQYSLAIVYQELLTGTLPFTGKNTRQLLLQHVQLEPDLQFLPAADRPAVARALAKDPRRRFPSCTDFIRALLQPPAPENGASATEPLAAPRAADAPNGAPTTSAVRPVSSVLTESLPGYRFLTRLASSPTAEVWKVQAPGGHPRLVKVLYGFVRHGPSGARQGEAEAVAQLAALRHPTLLPTEVVQHGRGRLVLLSPLVESTLRDHFQACRVQGEPGIPRWELLGYLRCAAEALDVLALQHGLQHLGLNPRNLLLDDDRLLVADFGLAQLLWAPAGQPIAQLNGRYSAPELFEQQISGRCDQYSLALIYQEMLTGVHPHSGQARQVLARSRSRCKPGLDLLPQTDREIIGRALEWDPQQRWPSCLEMIQALEEAGPGTGSGRETPIPASRARPGAGTPLSAQGAQAQAGLQQLVTELVATAAGSLQLNGQHDPSGARSSREGDVLHQKYSAPLPPEAIRGKLGALRRQWNGQVIREDDDWVVLHVSRPLGFWQRWLGRQAGLEVHIHLANRPGTPGSTDVHVTVQPTGCGREQGAQLVKGVGPLLLASICATLQVTAERRGQDRVAWKYPVSVRFVLANRELSEPVSCMGKDISLTGMGFYLPPELPTSQIVLAIHPPAHLAVRNEDEAAGERAAGCLEVPASIVRVQRCSTDWYEVGARFLLGTGERTASGDLLAVAER